MIQENEIVMLSLGLVLFIFVLILRPHLSRIPAWKLLATAYGFMLTAWCLTVLEGFAWPVICNFLEHFCYAVSMVLLAVWCRKLGFTSNGGRPS